MSEPNYTYDQTYDEYSLWDDYGPMPWDTINTLQTYYPDPEAELRQRNRLEYGGTAPMHKRTIRYMCTGYELVPEPIDIDTWEGEGGA